MGAEPDLFGDLAAVSAPPGLQSWTEVVTPAEEAELITRIDEAGLAPFRFQGWLGKRLTRSFGWSYDFDKGQIEQGAPLPDWLLPLRDRLAAVAGLESAALVQALLIRYDPGAGIGWHKDRPMFEHVVGLSLSSPAEMRLRRRLPKGFERSSAPLAPRSLYHLSGEVRDCWEHSILPMDVPRWSITFRSLREGAAKNAQPRNVLAD
jgi:alkylated DNA repair dioxygenase AlkB